MEIFHFLGVLNDVFSLALSVRSRCEYKLPGGTEVLRITEISPALEPTPSTPYVSPTSCYPTSAPADPSIYKPNSRLLGQYNTEAILRSHIERLGGKVEYGTELRSFEQHPDRVDAVLVTKDGDTEKTETVAAHYLAGADGARGIVRKQLGLSFLGETRVEGQILLGLVEVKGLGTEVRIRLSERQSPFVYRNVLQYWHQWGELAQGG